jgi:uncharacterized protein YeaO (DUF488 family)
VEPFNGTSSDWEDFYFQFRNLSKQRGWSKEKKLDNFLACLQGKALKFANRQPSHVLCSFRLLKKALHEKFAPEDSLEPFIGTPSDWEAFYYQFRDLSQQQGWNGEKKLDEFVDCLQGKALTFANRQPSQVRCNFRLLKKALHERFSPDGLYQTAKRQPAPMHQVPRKRLTEEASQVSWSSVTNGLLPSN